MGKELRIPLAAFGEHLASRHELGVFFHDGTNNSFVVPSRLHIVLDDVTGMPLPAIQEDFHMEDGAFSFTPFSTSPGLLRINHNDAVIADSVTSLFFMDYACYQANPRFDCGV